MCDSPEETLYEIIGNGHKRCPAGVFD